MVGAVSDSVCISDSPRHCGLRFAPVFRLCSTQALRARQPISYGFSHQQHRLTLPYPSQITCLLLSPFFIITVFHNGCRKTEIKYIILNFVLCK